MSAVDFEHKLVRTSSGHELSYDHLVLATGSISDYFGKPQLAEATLGMKTLAQAQRLRNHVLACLEHAAQTTDEDERRGWLTFVVVGGGPTGVEFAGALVELRRLVGREYPEFPASAVRIVVVEGAQLLLPAFPEKLGRYAQKILERRGVEVRTGVVMVTADQQSAALSNGEELATRTVVWSAGVRARHPPGIEELERGRAHRLQVDDRLRVGLDGVYAIGDVAATASGELPMLSAPAMQQGRYVADPCWRKRAARARRGRFATATRGRWP